MLRIFRKLFGGEMTVPQFAMPPEGELQKTPSGLRYKHLAAGAGKRPSAASEVTVHYAGWTTSGKLFAISVRPSPRRARSGSRRGSITPPSLSLA